MRVAGLVAGWGASGRSGGGVGWGSGGAKEGAMAGLKVGPWQAGGEGTVWRGEFCCYS